MPTAATGVKHTPANVKLMMPPRQSRGTALYGLGCHQLLDEPVMTEVSLAFVTNANAFKTNTNAFKTNTNAFMTNANAFVANTIAFIIFAIVKIIYSTVKRNETIISTTMTDFPGRRPLFPSRT
jgi:hypothetical protein